jgi:hypothetical protein
VSWHGAFFWTVFFICVFCNCFFFAIAVTCCYLQLFFFAKSLL